MEAIVWLLMWLFIGYLIALFINSWNIKTERKQAVSQSRSVILWEVSEKIAPILPDFEYNPKDMVFLGKWVDYVIFDGLASGNLNKIVFLEVKSWKSSLNKNERQIKDCIAQNNVHYNLFRMNQIN